MADRARIIGTRPTDAVCPTLPEVSIIDRKATVAGGYAPSAAWLSCAAALMWSRMKFR